MNDLGRTTSEILANAETLAKRFEDWEPDPARTRDAAAVRELHHAFQQAAQAQQQVVERVAAARTAGLSWAQIGAVMGTSGQAARKRCGQPDPEPPGIRPPGDGSPAEEQPEPGGRDG
jgi:hypothetical protein